VRSRLPHTESLGELAGLAALGALDGSDRDAFEGHLRERCRACESALAAWRRDLSLVALSVPEVAPPAELRARLLEERGASPAFAPRGTPASATRALAIAAAVLLAIVALDDVARRRSVRASQQRAEVLSARLEQSRADLARKELRARFLEDPDVQTIFLSGQAAAPGSRGKVLFSSRARRAILVAAELPALPAGRQYELWFIAGGKPIAAGTFDASATGATIFESTPLPEGAAPVEKFAVTIEPLGGVPRPTGPMVLLGG
jgi:anti-sigma-K factor RskA